MRRLAIPALAVAIAAGLLALLGFGVAHLGSDTSIDASVARGDYPTAPNAHLRLPVLGASGSESLAQLRGKVVVVNVFASWCPQRIAKDNATILGVTYQDNSNDSEAFVRQHRITYPVVRDVSGNFVRAFGTTGVPETFVINREGKIVALQRSQLDATWLQQTLPRILAERPGSQTS
jgi:cytochrome c biogenesis protein CcmG/thiol:disulfide interchange protein DsbE